MLNVRLTEKLRLTNYYMADLRDKYGFDDLITRHSLSFYIGTAQLWSSQMSDFRRNATWKSLTSDTEI